MAKDEEVAPSPVMLQEFTCDRCGYVYKKSFDFVPYLCYRCIRFIAKRDWVTSITIVPPARTEREDI